MVNKISLKSEVVREAFNAAHLSSAICFHSKKFQVSFKTPLVSFFNKKKPSIQYFSLINFSILIQTYYAHGVLLHLFRKSSAL